MVPSVKLSLASIRTASSGGSPDWVRRFQTGSNSNSSTSQNAPARNAVSKPRRQPETGGVLRP